MTSFCIYKLKYYSLIYYSGLNLAGIMDDDVDKYVKQKFPKGHTSTWRLKWWQLCQTKSFCGVEYLGHDGKEKTQGNMTWKELKERYSWKKEKEKICEKPENIYI